MVKEIAKSARPKRKIALADKVGLDFQIGKYIRIRLILFTEYSFINFPLFEFLDLIFIFAKVNWVLAEITKGFLVICIENRSLQEQSESRSLWNGNFLVPITLDNALDVATAPHDKYGHGNHFSNLMHHEALAVYLEAEPLCPINDKWRPRNFEGLDNSFRCRVTEGVLNRVVVEIS